MLAARDLRSNLGSNLALVRESTGLDPWQAGSKQVKAALQVAHRAAVLPQDRWRVACLQKLLATRLQAYYTVNEEELRRLQGLIESLVLN